MINISAQIHKVLSPIAPTFFGQPNVTAKLPCISYFELINQSALDADNIEIESSITYQIDIWDDKATERDEAADLIDKAIRDIGGIRRNCRDIVEEKNYHKVMEYRFYIENED